MNNLISPMKMHEQASNWHLWQCCLGSASQWLDTNHAILSHVGLVSKGLFWLLVVGGLSPLFVLQWLCGHTTWPWCSVSLWHILNPQMGDFGKLHQWNRARVHCYCRCQGEQYTRQQARRAQVDLTSNDPRNLLKINFSKSKWLVSVNYVFNSL